MNHQVNIPQDFFLQEASKEYWNLSNRLVAELIQNSVDAGSTKIEFEFSDEGYSCEDNGCGMSKEVIIPAMLTLGGSVKSQGATGGFGAAKKLLLFAQDSYQIRTRNILVNGKVLSYEMDEDLFPYAGTRISAKYIKGFNHFSESNMVAATKKFLEKCLFWERIEIYINGELFDDYQGAKLHRSNEGGLGDIYIQRNQPSNHIQVLHNGLWMFSAYTGNCGEHGYLLNVTMPSKDVFSQSRDAFRGNWDEVFSKIKEDLMVNATAFALPKDEMIDMVIEGKYRKIQFVCEKFSEQVGEIFKRLLQNGDDFVSALRDMRYEHRNVLTVSDTDHLREMETLFSDPHSVPYVDFSVYGRVPDKMNVEDLNPATGKKRYKSLAALYKTIISEVFRTNGISGEYSLGFIIEDGVKGMCRNGCLMINPKVSELKSVDKKEYFWEIFSIAIHEIVHFLNYHEHNEIFAAKVGELTTRTLSRMRGMTELIQEARQQESYL